MATKVYPSFDRACTVNTTDNSDILVLNDNNFDTWYEVLGIDYDPGNKTKRPQDAQQLVSQYRHGSLASSAANTKEGGLTFKIEGILDGERLKISKRAGATATGVAMYFLKNETMQSAILTSAAGVVTTRPKDAAGEVFPFQAADTFTVVTAPEVSASAL